MEPKKIGAYGRAEERGIVRLIVRDAGTWYEVSCEVCREIVACGQKEVLQIDLTAAIARTAPLHLHPGM